MLQKTLCILVLLILLSDGTPSFAQDTVHHNIAGIEVDFSYNGQAGREDYKNPIIRDLSLSLQVPIRDISFNFTCKVETILEKVNDTDYKLTQRLLEPETGPFLYREMDISGTLYPGYSRFLLEIRDTSGILVRKVNVEHDLNDSTATEPATDILFLMPEPVEIGELSIADTQWVFTRKDYERFREGVEQVDDYYAAGSLLNELVGKYENEFPNDLGLMEQVSNYLEMKRVLGVIEKQVNPGREVRGTSAETVYLESSGLAERFGRRMKTLSEISLEKGQLPDSLRMDYHAGYLVGLHDRYFTLSEETDHRYTKYYNDFARIRSFGEFIVEPWQELIPEQNPNYRPWNDRYLELFLQGMLESYLLKYNTYDSVQDYHRALIFLQNASMVYSKIYEPDRRVDFDELFTRTERGMVNAYKRIIDRALETDNLYIADIYFKELMNRLKMSGGYYKFDTLLDYYSSELAYSFLEKSGQLNFGGNAGEALVFLDMAENLCEYEGLCLPDTLPAFRRDLDSLKAVAKADKIGEYLESGDVIKAEMELDELYKLGSGSEIYKELYDTFAVAKFDYYLNIGDRYLIFDQYEDAWRAFSLAAGYYYRYSFLDGDKLYEKFESAARPVVLDNLDLITYEFAENNYALAKDAHKKASELYADYVQDDPVIDSLLAVKYNLIESSRCSFASISVDSLYREAEIKLTGGDLSAVRGDFGMIGEIIEKNPDCDIDRSVLVRRLELLNSIEIYYERLNALNAEDSASLFIEMSFGLDDFYSQHDFNQYIPEHIPTLERVIASEDEQLMSALLEYYSETSGDRQSLEILWKMKKAGIKSKDLRIYQSELGKRLAVADYNEKPDGDPYIVVNEYTLNYSFFKHLRKAYLAKWGELSGDEKKSLYIWRKIKKPFTKKK